MTQTSPQRSFVKAYRIALFFIAWCACGLFFGEVCAQTSKPSPSYARCSALVHQKQWSRAQRCFCALYRTTHEPYHIKNLAKIQTLAAFHAEQSPNCPSTPLVLRQQAIASYRAYRSFLQSRRLQSLSSTELEQIALSLRQLRVAIRDVRVSFPSVATSTWPQGSLLRIEGSTVRCMARYPALVWTCQTKAHSLPVAQTCGLSWVRRTPFVRAGRIWLPSGCYRTFFRFPSGEEVAQSTRLYTKDSTDHAAFLWPTIPPRRTARLGPSSRPGNVTKRPVLPRAFEHRLWMASGISVGLGLTALAGGFVLHGVGQGALEDAKRMAYKETNWRASYEQASQTKEIGRALWIASAGLAALGLGLGIAALVQKNALLFQEKQHHQKKTLRSLGILFRGSEGRVGSSAWMEELGRGKEHP